MWDQIQANQRRSVVLVLVLGVVLVGLGYLAGEALAAGAGLIGSLAALLLLGVQSAVYFAAGESVLLQSARARPLQREDHPRLFNLVEEMKLASGLEFFPRVFLVDSPVPNAFAVGRSPAGSAVAVTSGLLQRLNRDQLQGVIAHEIAHLNNHDARFMTLAAVLVGSIILLAEMTGRMLGGMGRHRRRAVSRGGGQAQLVWLLLALVCALLAPLLAQLLYFACSRKREYLADACAAQYTRYPEGLASALETIAGCRQSQAEFVSRATAPLFIVNPLAAEGGGFSSWFSTHPPTAERVRILRSMAGASLADYESAYRQVRGGQSLIGAALQTASAPTAIRAPSADAAEGFDRREIRSLTQRLDGYVAVSCACGLQTRVPSGFGGEEFRCVRCGTTLAIPAAREARGSSSAVATEASPLQYRRRTSGWESFRCRCGQTLQLSPSFRAPRLKCRKCGREIEVVPAG